MSFRFGIGVAFGLAALMCVADSGFAGNQPDPPPPWAFPINISFPVDSAANKTRLQHAPRSPNAFTEEQLNDHFFAADWFPQSHPPMPAIVASGRKPHAWACGFCHLPNGQGGAESASLRGLPADYIIQQVEEMREGRRSAAEPKMISPNGMIREARAVTIADLKAAAAYFSSLPFTSNVRVVETDTVPKTDVAGVSLLAPIPNGGKEPLGKRIVEVPEDFKRYDMGDSSIGFVAYVPHGSIRRGAILVASGGGVLPCRNCHGPDLNGSGMAPPLAGRSPSYLVRQLYDIQYGTRRGPTVALMLPEVAHMTADDRIAIAAYLASRRPSNENASHKKS